jgi:hypothetical protein
MVLREGVASAQRARGEVQRSWGMAGTRREVVVEGWWRVRDWTWVGG